MVDLKCLIHSGHLLAGLQERRGETGALLEGGRVHKPLDRSASRELPSSPVKNVNNLAA